MASTAEVYLKMICDKCNETVETCHVDWFLTDKKPQYRRLCHNCWRAVQRSRGAVRGAATCGLSYD